MHIESLYLENFRNYREINIPFSKGTNLILGSSDSWYYWTASGDEIVIYEADTLFASESFRYNYQFLEADLLLIGTAEYDRQ